MKPVPDQASRARSPDSADRYWTRTGEDLLAALGSAAAGLADTSAAARLAREGPNRVTRDHRAGPLALLRRQFASPLVLILLAGAVVSLALRDWSDAGIIAVIVISSALLGFAQEYRASQAVAALQQRLALRCTVLRGGAEREIPVTDIVPGDIVRLSAGNLAPADGVLLETRDLTVSEAALTGESFPVEKRPGVSAAEAPLAERRNCLFAGSSVRSGTATLLVVRTGAASEYGKIAQRLGRRAPETDFERGVRHFGEMLLRAMFLMVVFVLAANQMMGRPFTESLLFAVALSVGLSPELLPAIVSITLSAGARNMARRGVIVRKLEAIEMLGSLDIVCTDKTGTITSGIVTLADAVDPAGTPRADVLASAFLNASLETGIANALDAAIVKAGEAAGLSATGLTKLDEIPYDFNRRRLTIVVAEPDRERHRLIVKGAVAETLSVCTGVIAADGEAPLDDARREALLAYVAEQGAQGRRVLAVAQRCLAPQPRYTVADEHDLVLLGFLLFDDPPKPGAREALRALAGLGVKVKVVSGDNRYVTAHVAREVGLDPEAILTGADIAAMGDEALWHAAERAQLFVEIDPQQKERIVHALRRRGHAVGFLGDGINDAPALYSADVGISVEGAVDVARESADVVLMTADLDVLRRGVEDGRHTFGNTMKYIAITTSANFGNMISMALAVPLLPFLPLLPKQILFNNLISDLPSMAIATDVVDPERLARPQRWDVREITRFMVVFGVVSSLFDMLTFLFLLKVVHADATMFHTTWFIVSVMTEIAVVLVLRTWRPAWRSRPSAMLAWSTAAVGLLTLALPFVPPIAALFGFVRLGGIELVASLGIVAAYILTTEAVKYAYVRRFISGPKRG
ncbi:magnesium-translocating P-type ATPase [Novosphingobium album (ex Liu et al. 2023)]|uniref:Magnesium-transporting ATPase, P-type 1 n=1 Tax=Novosphingobium album (ex Liu et al. 2023) TaxID=3031130 RepID=A0ABT5WQD0_9SPHN|nr:magnesium-translocating P-type ATPase [Novosphingobium album (ex Liu et al. 2023)]MDE8651193.1 magnesium-translocating P-type ATPase [Novosphingobium album (ex Liu et al. 2023)]